jgi:hypothetical protein
VEKFYRKQWEWSSPLEGIVGKCGKCGKCGEVWGFRRGDATIMASHCKVSALVFKHISA